MNMGKNNHRKEKGIKIIDPKKIDYTFTDKDDPSNIKSSSYNNEKNIGSSGKSKTERKDIDRLRHNITKDTKIRNKGRIAGGQSKQSHSSVYE
ncbi:MAG TPA: hypothetical protein VF233_12810 [Nitrososphaeraceae archaeon]